MKSGFLTFSYLQNSTKSDEKNNADWFGLEKVEVTGGLAKLLRTYILYLSIVTLHAIVVLTQRHKR